MIWLYHFYCISFQVILRQGGYVLGLPGYWLFLCEHVTEKKTTEFHGNFIGSASAELLVWNVIILLPTVTCRAARVIVRSVCLLLCAVNEWTHEWIFVFLISCLNLSTYLIIKYLHNLDLNIFLSCITIIILHNSVSVCSCVYKISFVCRDGNTNVEMSEVGM